jgi:NAD(P)-dependent dehydrogenase (short-subunit alcohol dehydrogenase family)
MSRAKSKTKVALVTGGAQGIGKGIAKRFLEEGMAVVIADADEEAGRETAKDLGRKCLFVRTDIASERDVKGCVQEIKKRFGRLDALVNNAGIGRGGPVTRLKIEDWNRVIGVNLTGPFLCVKHAAPLLKRSKGAIINIASTRAVMSEANTEAYSASKGGILALTHALAISLGPAVRVNCILPGWINVTEWKKSVVRKKARLTKQDHLQHPAGRVGRPEDIAALAAFLVSEEAGFITGAAFTADGGMTRKMIYVE